MPTPPTYTNAFRVVGSAAELFSGQPSWGFFRSPVIGVSTTVNSAANTSSWDYDTVAYAQIDIVVNNLFRTWSPFQLQAVFDGSGGFTIQPWESGDPPNYDFPLVDENDFNGGIVAGTVTASTGSGSGTFTILAESGNHNGVAQATAFSAPITAIVLP
jgi:hypothetical protein